MGKTNTKKMVQGAMIASIFGALSLINTYTGSIFDLFICYGMVIPLVWYGYTYTLKDNMIVCIVAMVVIAMMGLPFFVISSFSSCLIGLFIGETLKRKAKKSTILLGTLGVTFLNNILLYEVFSGLLGIDLISEMQETYLMFVDMFPSLANHISLNAVLSMIPLIILIMSVLEMYVIVMLCQLILLRLKIEFPGSFHIAMLHLSMKTGIIIASGMFGTYLIQNVMNINNIYLSYIYTLCTMTFALEGLAFLSWFLIIKEKPKLIILVFIGILIPIMNSIYVVVGIIDIFSDLREKILYNKHNDD